MTFIPYLIATCNRCGCNSAALDGVIFTRTMAWKELQNEGWTRRIVAGDVERSHFCPDCKDKTAVHEARNEGPNEKHAHG